MDVDVLHSNRDPNPEPEEGEFIETDIIPCHVLRHVLERRRRQGVAVDSRLYACAAPPLFVPLTAARMSLFPALISRSTRWDTHHVACCAAAGGVAATCGMLLYMWWSRD